MTQITASQKMLLKKVIEHRNRVLISDKQELMFPLNKTNFSNFIFRLCDINNCIQKNGKMRY